MKELNWTVLTNAIFLARFSLHGTSPSDTLSKWSVYLCMTIILSLPEELFDYKRFSKEKIMEQWLSSLDLNPIKNLWSVEKMELFEGGK